MARRIKRYDNRKLYDTETSEYVSLSDIADLVRGGETVEVVDNVTGPDITDQTLTQIILEEGKSGRTSSRRTSSTPCSAAVGRSLTVDWARFARRLTI